jgi:tetratricopeptide (TPR) repeat protein
MRHLNLLRAFLLASTLLTGAAAAHDQAKTELKQFGPIPHAADRVASTAEAPLWGNLGSLTYRVTTSSPEAQAYFDQGMALTYGFNHAEARRSFQAAQQLDPACAMCFWGEALVLGPNINAPMDAAAAEPAMAALRKAQALAHQASEKEQALIEALGARYAADPQADRAALDRAYADAMEKVAARFPEDLEIATLTAEALMDLSPWNYWGDGGKTPTGRTAAIVSTLERVLAANPDHMGAIHYYIHAVEASADAKRAEPYAERLAAQKLGAGHLVHMPSHIYFRLGRYAEALELNKAAVAADEAYIAAAKPEGIYPGGYYPHNIHFLLASAQMAGDGPTAIDAAEKLQATVSDEAARAMPAFVQPIKAAPLFAHAQFSTPEVVLALPAPGADMPYVEAMWHYARGAAHAAKGDLQAARAEAEAIAAIGREADFSALTAGGVPAAEVVDLARHIVLARAAQAGGDLDAAIAEFQAAAAIQAGLAYMEPPYWYYPVRQSLGAVLLLAGRTEEAEQAFRTSLEATPNNGWACFGLLQVHKARGETDQADALAARLERTWSGPRELLDLRRL